MVVLIAEIEYNCFYVKFSILLLWRLSYLFNVSLEITGYVSLHNQMPLHITFTKLVFTGNYICFYYIMIYHNDHQYTPSVLFRLHDPDKLIVDFEYVIVSVILFALLLANKIMIFSRSTAYVLLVLSCLLNPSVLTANLEQVIVPVICFLPCLLTTY